MTDSASQSDQPPLESDDRFNDWQNWPGVVLLSDEIEHYCNGVPPLITPFGTDNLKPARYILTLGDEARLDGETIHISPGQPLKLEPHQVAVVRTLETINLPRFLIARWKETKL